MAGPTHVYCRLHLDEPGDVHRPSVRAGSARAHWARTEQDEGLDQESVGQDLASGELEDRQLQARVYYNRGTSLLVQQEPGAGTPILQRCVPTRSARSCRFVTI